MTVEQHNPNDTPVISLTDKAIKHVRKHLEKLDTQCAFRLYVTTTGCTGYMYKVNYVNDINPEDIAVEVSPGLTVYVERKTAPLVHGTEIDIEKKGLNEVLTYNNPNSEANCGCGESFAIKKEDGE